MEKDITNFYHSQNTRVYSDSIANSGSHDIGVTTWNNALITDWKFITTEEERLIVLNHVKNMGMDDVDKMDINEANALFIQLVSGDIQEKDDMTWEEYQQSDQVSGSLFETDGKIYYFIDEF